MEDIIDQIKTELVRSAQLHPNYPVNDLLRCAAITVEEAGEVIQAALDATNPRATADAHNKALDNLYKENVQTAAMAIKHLLALRGVNMKEFFAS
jgi:hypothetical protein